MQSAATIRDAAHRLEEAALVFRQKSRNALEEYGEWTASWNDARARKFSMQHIEPQRDLIEQGTRLCQIHGELSDTARAASSQAEHEITSFFAAQSAFESAAESARQTASAAREQATRAMTDSSRILAEVQSIRAAIESAAMDPGW